MIGLPHRVGAAYAILGQANGTEPRFGHVLNDNVYGDGSTLQYHTYFGNYPETTTPDYIITKAAGTLGEDYTYTSIAPNNMPGNIIKLVSYKTELNHYIPTAAASAEFNTPSYDSTPYWGYYPPDNPTLNSGWSYGTFAEWSIVNPTIDTLISTVLASYTEITDVTDNLDGSVTGFVSSKFYPRWKDEGQYEQLGNLFPPIQVTVEDDAPFYQTREGPGMTPPESQVGLSWICPWTIKSGGAGLSQQLNIDCNVSYKFTKNGANVRDSVPFKIVYYRDKGEWLGPPFNIYDPITHNEWIPDISSKLQLYDTDGFYDGRIATGTRRLAPCKVWPVPAGEEYPYVNYQNTSTHGLFLAANGSCWNIGAEIKVKVHIWKCPPKFCLYYRNHDKDGGGIPYTNWKTGVPYRDATPDFYYRYEHAINPRQPAYFQYDKVCSRIYGPGDGSPYDETWKFEGGIWTGVEYSTLDKAYNLHYWGTVFTMDTDSELNVEHEVKEFTITIGEDNTYYCDGSLREEVEMTPEGFKIADVVIPPVEGYITYIKDFEVTSIKKPPATPP
jgi:hypothetical protein